MMHQTTAAHTHHAAGTVVTIHRQAVADRFSTIPNAVLRDRRLSARARGVLVYLLSLADGWQTTADRLAAEFTEGRDAIRTALRELEAAGYLRRHKYRDENKAWRSRWEITDDPATFQAETLPLDELSTGNEPGRVSSAGFPAPGFQAIDRSTSEEPKRGGRDGATAPVVHKHAGPPAEDNEDQAEDVSAPWCAKHPGGTDAPCRPCGRARVAHEAAEAARTAARAAEAQRVAEARKTAPACPHGVPGGVLPAGDGRPYCPLCRNGAEVSAPRPAMRPSVDLRAEYEAGKAEA